MHHNNHFNYLISVFAKLDGIPLNENEEQGVMTFSFAPNGTAMDTKVTIMNSEIRFNLYNTDPEYSIATYCHDLPEESLINSTVLLESIVGFLHFSFGQIALYQILLTYEQARRLDGILLAL